MEDIAIMDKLETCLFPNRSWKIKWAILAQVSI